MKTGMGINVAFLVRCMFVLAFTCGAITGFFLGRFFWLH